MIKYNDAKITANEFAKLMVFNMGENVGYWEESYYFEAISEIATKKEMEEIEAAITKHMERIREFLGVNKIFNKVYKD